MKILGLFLVSAALTGCGSTITRACVDPTRLLKQLDIATRQIQVEADGMTMLGDCVRQDSETVKTLRCVERSKEILKKLDELKAENEAN